eukprot:Pgem_evm1s26
MSAVANQLTNQELFELLNRTIIEPNNEGLVNELKKGLDRSKLTGDLLVYPERRRADRDYLRSHLPEPKFKA